MSGIQPVYSELPLKFELFQNYPNPFNPITKIHFDLTDYSRVKLIVYDMLGREVKNTVNSTLAAGIYIYDFAGNDFASGVYFTDLSLRIIPEKDSLSA